MQTPAPQIDPADLDRALTEARANLTGVDLQVLASMPTAKLIDWAARTLTELDRRTGRADRPKTSRHAPSATPRPVRMPSERTFASMSHSED